VVFSCSSRPLPFLPEVFDEKAVFFGDDYVPWIVIIGYFKVGVANDDDRDALRSFTHDEVGGSG